MFAQLNQIAPCTQQHKPIKWMFS